MRSFLLTPISASLPIQAGVRGSLSHCRCLSAVSAQRTKLTIIQSHALNRLGPSHLYDTVQIRALYRGGVSKMIFLIERIQSGFGPLRGPLRVTLLGAVGTRHRAGAERFPR